MPKINRIRIVNFSYNHDTRHIVDECFNFHGGENALLNLANGGGKSVLVQLMLQVVVPGVKIQGRAIASFFRHRKLPAYIMIEWKLDGGGGYLLTGIGITAAEAEEQESSRPRIRYFNFTSKYIGASAFDIISIPLIERNGEVLEVKPFREARKIMADKEKKEPYLVGYYPEDDRDGYVKRLAEFGIVQDEWRNIIARINDSENGLEDLFQKYKSSSQLLDDWIIKTVEKVMFKSSSEQRQLEEMLHSLVQEVVENEHFIREKNLFNGFLHRLQGVLAELGDLLQDLEEQKTLESNLAALYGFLGGAMDSLQDQLQAGEQAIDDARGEENKVTLEERSHDYLQRKEEHLKAEESLAAAESTYLEAEDALDTALKQEKVMQAAGLNMEIRQKSSELSGIEEKLVMARADYDKDERARCLEYGLKTRYEELLNSLAERLAHLHSKHLDCREKLDSSKPRLRAMEAEKSRLDAERGRLGERLKTFHDRERQLQERLGKQWIRNLLGELDQAALDQIANSLLETKNKLLTAHQEMLNTKSSLAQRRQDIDQEWKGTQTARADNARVLHDYERNLDAYLQEEQQVKEILNRYGFEASLCFEKERLSSLFSRHINELENKIEAASRAQNEVTEALSSIKNGCLHTSPELASALAGLDIQYDTGESYLRNQHPDICQKMLAANPLLPYTFIMARADINRMAKSGNLNMVLRRIIPLMAYEDLSLSIESRHGIARPREELALACLYEGRVFNNDDMQALIEELEKKGAETAERYNHYAEAHRNALLDSSACRRFEYQADFRYQMEQAINACLKQNDHLDRQLATLEAEQIRINQQLDQLEQQAEKLLQQMPRAEEALQAFGEFMEKEPEYQTCRNRLNQTEQQIKGLEQEKEQLQHSLEMLQTDISSTQSQIAALEKEEQGAGQQYLIYKEAPSSEHVEGSIEELEKRLTAIKQEYSQEIGHLEQLQKELTSQCGKLQKQLDKLGLSEEDYGPIIFDEAALEAIQEEKFGLEARLKVKQAQRINATRAEAAAAMAADNALAEVKRLGAEAPLPPREIKGSFEGRRNKLQRQIAEITENNKDISRKLSRWSRIMENIENTIDLSGIEARQSFVPDADIASQASRWMESIRSLQSRNRENAGAIRQHYNDCKMDYREKNLNLDSIFKGLDPLWDKARTEYDDFFYLFERMGQHGDKLAELIAVNEAQLANLERNKTDMVQQSFLQGRRIFEEINLISENSKVRLQGRTRLVQMLKIDLQFDNYDLARQRINDYIEECIAKVREKVRETNRDDEVRKTVSRLMSSRELLNVYAGSAHIPVSVFKIDMNMQNSRLKSWEDAVRENSGGEKFVVFFSLLSALMAYTRARNMEALGADPDTDTRVLIMDNPFGPISSEHLLQPMFEIAKRHRTQLICLSDLKQNSIMNCFNLIYMLKVRTAAIGADEYLKFEEYVRDASLLQNDEKLEKAVYRASEYQQMPLFGDDETR